VRTVSLISCLFAAITVTAAASAADQPPETIVVTASRIPVPLSTVGSSITVIDREQIERRESVFAIDMLRDVPGVAVSQSGSIGSQTQIRMRGAEANQILVLIDGVKANDPAGNAEFAFENLGTWDIERIEVVRGAQSGLWGSDALAGVINVITRQPDEELSVSGFGEGGAFDTWAAGTRIGGAVLGTRAGLSFSTVDSDGTNSSRTGSENDGYRNRTANLSVASSPVDNLDLELNGRYSDIHKEFDSISYLTGLPADTLDETDMSLAYFGGKGTLRLLENRWTQSLRAGWTHSDTDNSNEFGANGSTDADRYAFYYQSTYHFTPASKDSTGNALTFALDHEREEFSQRGTATEWGDPNQDQSERNTGLIVEGLFSPLSRVSVSLSVRRDDNSSFEDINTYRATTAWTDKTGGTRLHASIGRGQKAPTFIERYGYFPGQFTGNPDLRPERSTAWEFGIDQALPGIDASAGATYFHEDMKDEIYGYAFDPESFQTTAVNLPGTSKRRGVELTAMARLSPGLKISATYTYTDANEPDAITGEEVREIRRPQHTGSLGADWSSRDGRLELDANLSYTGSRNDDYWPPSFIKEVVELGAYKLVSLAATYRVTDATRIYTRIDNLFDSSYEDVYGYNTGGIGAYAGLRFDF
jgi:vitamin B12 transporter